MNKLEKLSVIRSVIEENHIWHEKFNAYGAYRGSQVYVSNIEGIRLCSALMRELELELGERDALTVAYMSGYHDGKKSKDNS